jgi:hypothetical protein
MSLDDLWQSLSSQANKSHENNTLVFCMTVLSFYETVKCDIEPNSPRKKEQDF